VLNLSSDVRFDPYAVELSEETKRELIDNIAEGAMSRELEAGVVFFFELTKPLSWIGIQFILAFSPLFLPFVNEQKFYEYAKLFEDRRNIEALIQRIERLRDGKELEEKKRSGSKSLKDRLLGFGGRRGTPK
jgi:hypothetical protein